MGYFRCSLRERLLGHKSSPKANGCRIFDLQSGRLTANKVPLRLLAYTTFRVTSVLQQDEWALIGCFPVRAPQYTAVGCMQLAGGVYAGTDSST